MVSSTLSEDSSGWRGLEMAPAAVVQHDLLDVAWGLTQEHSDEPAGSVLRCFARSVRRAVASGVALPDVAQVAAEITRAQLRARSGLPS